MSPRKNRPVLYEVHARTLRGKGRGFIPRAPQPPQPRGASPPPATPPAPAAPAAAPSAAPAAQRTARPAFETDAGAWSGVRYGDGRVYLGLGWPHLAVIGVVLLAIIVGAFQFGRASATPATESVQQRTQALEEQLAHVPPVDTPRAQPAAQPAEGARGGEPRPGQGRRDVAVAPGPEPRPVVQQPEADPRTSARPVEPAPQATFTPQRGSFYVLVQYFRRTAQGDAQKAAAYLAENGIPSAVVEGAGDWQLVATQPFSSEAQARALADRIKALGREYFRAGNGYAFDGAAPRRY